MPLERTHMPAIINESNACASGSLIFGTNPKGGVSETAQSEPLESVK